MKNVEIITCCIIIAILSSSCLEVDKMIPDPAPCKGMPLVIHEGKEYPTIQIGNQCWLTENLDVGTFISSGQEMSDNGIIEKYCYENDTINCAIYGGLYQWDEIMKYVSKPGAKGICPPGWHIPTIDEWFELSEYLGKGYLAGEMLKDNSKGLWDEPNSGALNGSGFSALPAGTLFADSTFSNLGLKTYFWASDEVDDIYAWNRILIHAGTKFMEVATKKENARSVRCIKNQKL